MIGAVLWMMLGAQAAAPARPVPPPPRFRLPPAAERRPVAYETVGGLAMFRVRVAGREGWALLDNRAERSLVDLSVARDAGLTIDPRMSVRIDAGAGLSGQRVREVPIAFPGQFAVTLPSMVGTDLAAVSRLMERPIALVVGADFYRQFAIVTLPGEGTLRFAKSGSVTMPLRAVELLDARPRIAIELGGEPMVVTIDTGMSAPLMLTPAAWQRLKLPIAACKERSFRTGDGSARTGRSCAGPAARIGPFSAPAIPVFISEVAAANGDGLIGMGLLAKAGGTVIDVTARKLWLLPPGRKIAVEPAPPAEAP